MKLQMTVRFNRLPRTVIATKEATLKIVEKAVADIAAGAKVRAPYKTGALQASYDFEVEGTFTGAEGITYTPLEYGIYQEYGPRPHLIPATMEVQAQLYQLARIIGPALEKAARGK